MLLLGFADCCRLIHRFAFTDSSVLLISITFCFDLPAFASFKRQTNGKLMWHFIAGTPCDGHVFKKRVKAVSARFRPFAEDADDLNARLACLRRKVNRNELYWL